MVDVRNLPAYFVATSTVGSRYQHSFGPGGISTDDKFKQVYWNIFPNTMQDWLTNDQNINPFDPAALLDVDEIADHL